MTTVNLHDYRDLQRVWPEVGRRIQAGMRRACISAADWGVAAGAREAQRSGVNASQTYGRSFLALRTRDGALLTNKAEHSYFVEVGRKPGKAPPVSVIGQWLALKGIMPRPPKGKNRKRRVTGDSVGIPARYAGIALAIMRKIKRHGTKGRFIIRGLLPALGKRMHRETRRQLLGLTRDPPR